MTAARGAVAEGAVAHPGLGAGRGSVRLARAAGFTGLAIVVATAAVAAFGAWSAGHWIAVDLPRLHGALVSPLAHVAWPLSRAAFLAVVVVMCGGYALVLAGAGHLPARWSVGAIVLVHALLAAAPVVLSTDVFSYADYARLGAVHGINPYVHTPAAAPADPSFALSGRAWQHTPSVYGPLFTLLTYPLAPAGVAATVWSLKALAMLAALATVGAVWRCARLRGLSPVRAALLVGLNPVWVVYGVGGAHNDLLMLALLMAAVLLALRGREAAAAVGVLAGAAVKLTGLVALPYLLLGRRARMGRAAFAGAAAAVTFVAIDIAAFGTGGAHVVSVLRREQGLVSADAFPNVVAHLVGLQGVYPGDHKLLQAGALAILAGLLVATWRGMDWIAAAGWAMATLVVTATWLVGWYTLWPLPLAAVSRDRRLIAVTLALEALFVARQLAPVLA